MTAAATDQTAYQRAYASARQRALARLAQLHRGEYAALLADERAKDQLADRLAKRNTPKENV